MTLTKRISFQLAAAISLMVFAYLMVLYQFVSVQTLLEETVQQIRQVDTLSQRLFQLQHDLDAEILTGRFNRPPEKQRIEGLGAEICAAGTQYLDQTKDPEKRQTLEKFLQIRKVMEGWEAKLIESDTSETAFLEFLDQWKREAAIAHNTLVGLGGARLRIQSDFLEKIDEKRNTTQKIAVFFVVVGAICLIAIWTYTRSNLLIPLRRLAKSAGAISKGEEVIQIPDTGRKDEVGILARSFESMVSAVQVRTEKLILNNLQLENEIKERRQVQDRLSEAKAELERRVESRTAEIQRRNTDLETLLHVTSHDLREPLRAIRHFSTILLESDTPNLEEDQKDYLSRIQRGAARLDQLIEDILLLSRAQRMEEEMVEVPGEELVREALGGLATKIEETGASIYIEEGFPTFKVSPRWVTQALFNLVGNSLKFVVPGTRPEVEISPYSGGDHQSDLSGFVVQDRGPGIHADYAEQVFGLFRRAVSREVEGTGSGLAIVKQVAERHGGRAWYQPREGGGSQFFLTLGKREGTEVRRVEKFSDSEVRRK